MADATKPLVVITGVTGYLGSSVCRTFLEDNSYTVRGTVRNKGSATKKLEAALGSLFERLELVEADLTDEDSLIAACQGASYVVHTASPFHFKGDCVGPAVAGTNAILKACSQHRVKRCVITSSCAAALAPADENKPVPPAAFDENCWSDPDRPQGLIDYQLSKTLAEKAAWEYQKSHDNSFEICTILPTFIMGPAPLGGDGTSEKWMKDILKGVHKKVPRESSSFVDVRDVALAHLRAVQLPSEAANQRFILYNQRQSLRDIYAWLAKFNDRGAKVPTELKAGKDPPEGDLVDNSRSKNILKIEYTPLEKTMMDHAEQILTQMSM